MQITTGLTIKHRLHAPIPWCYHRSGLLNARLQYTDASERFTAVIFGTNLTNKYHLVGGTRFGTEATVATGVVDLGRPREIGAELRFNF